MFSSGLCRSLTLTLLLWINTISATPHPKLPRSPHSSAAKAPTTDSVDAYCPVYQYPKDPLNDLEDAQEQDTTSTSSSNIPAKDHALRKRIPSSPNKHYSIGHCKLPNNQFVKAPDFSGLADLRQRGRYPDGWNGMNGYIYNAVPKWYVAERHCEGYSWYRTGGSGPEDIPAESLQSVDHVCKSHASARILKSCCAKKFSGIC